MYEYKMFSKITKSWIYCANVPIGSQAGKTVGCFLNTWSTSSGIYFLSMTTSKTNSLNHSLVMTRKPLSPRSSPHEFSTRYLDEPF